MPKDHSVIPNIEDPEFDFYNEIFDRLDKVRLIADVIFIQKDSDLEVSSTGLCGAYAVLDESVKDLRTICMKLCGMGVQYENH